MHNEITISILTTHKLTFLIVGVHRDCGNVTQGWLTSRENELMAVEDRHHQGKEKQLQELPAATHVRLSNV